MPAGQRFVFNDKLVEKIKPPPRLRAKGTSAKGTPMSQQVVYTDAGCKGLSLIVGSGGAKTYRSQFKLFDKWQTRKLGKQGDYTEDENGLPDRVTVDWARNQVRLDKLDAEQGRNPADRVKRVQADSQAFVDVVREYLGVVETQQRTFSDTKRILQVYCKPLGFKPLSTITKDDVQSLLNHYRDQGKTRTAQAILMKLKALWKWAHKQDYVETFVVEKCSAPHRFTRREKVYDDAELKAVWDAAGKLEPHERDYTRLLVLLVPRRKALAQMQRSHLNADVSTWTVPFDLVKAKATSRPRTYRVPLPPLARSILEARLADDDNDFVFGTAPGVPYWPGAKLKRRLVKAGAPKSFMGHSLRHTCATWFENRDHSPWDRGLLLNHSETGVTSEHYSMGDPKGRKLVLLTMWEDYIRKAVGLPARESSGKGSKARPRAATQPAVSALSGPPG